MIAQVARASQIEVEILNDHIWDAPEVTLSEVVAYAHNLALTASAEVRVVEAAQAAAVGRKSEGVKSAKTAAPGALCVFLC